ncbi:tRNA (guanine(10)-N2)-methyltransferase-like protein, partial [Frankliniella fusca]
MEPIVILGEVVEATEILSETLTESSYCRPRKRRKNRRALFSSTRTKHKVTVSKSFEPSASEHFTGFPDNTVLGTTTPPPSDFCGFSDADISFSMTRKTLHPLYGGHWEDMYDECGQTVCSIDSKFPLEHIMKYDECGQTVCSIDSKFPLEHIMKHDECGQTVCSIDSKFPLEHIMK